MRICESKVVKLEREKKPQHRKQDITERKRSRVFFLESVCKMLTKSTEKFEAFLIPS